MVTRHNQLSRTTDEAITSREGVTCILPATTVTSPWSVLEPEYEREAVDELSHAKKLRAMPCRPPLPPSPLRPPSPLVRHWLPHWRRPEQLPVLDAPPLPTPPPCSGRHRYYYRRLPQLGCRHHATLAVGVPAIPTVDASPFVKVALLQLLLRSGP